LLDDFPPQWLIAKHAMELPVFATTRVRHYLDVLISTSSANELKLLAADFIRCDFGQHHAVFKAVIDKDVANDCVVHDCFSSVLALSAAPQVTISRITAADAGTFWLFCL
jgi:hypothetical protein